MTRTVFPGFTLTEVLIAIAISATLTLAISSVILVSGKTLELSSSPSAKGSKVASELNRLFASIQTANQVESFSNEKISLLVADRDDDGIDDKIAFEFNVSQNRLEKSTYLSGSNADTDYEILLGDIKSFSFNQLASTRGQNTLANPESETTLLWSYDDEPVAPGNRVLLVVSDASLLSADESYRKDWLTSNSYLIETISVNSSTLVWSSALTRNDFIFVSPDLSADDLPDSLVQSTLGIVFENSDQAERLQLAKPVSNSTGKSIVLDSRFHYTTRNTKIGGHIISSVNTGLSSISNNASQRSSDLEVLASGKEGPCFALLNKSAEAFSDSSPESGVFGSLLNHSTASDASYLFKHVASKFELTEKARISNIRTLLSTSDQSKTRFGIYTNQNGNPGSLIAQTDLIVLQEEDEPEWISAPPNKEIVLNPGTYWIAAAIDNSTSFFYGASDGNPCNGSNGVRTSADTTVSISDGLPTHWPNVSVLEFCEISIHVDYQTVPSVAGRRILLPWKDSSFRYSDLSDDANAWFQYALNWVGDASPDDTSTELVVNSNQTFEQYIAPQSPESNANGWNIQRASIRLKPNLGIENPTIRFQYYLANADQTASNTLVGESDWTDISNLPTHKFSWFEIPIFPTSQIDIADGVVLVLTAQSSIGDVILAVDEEIENPSRTGGSPSTFQVNDIPTGEVDTSSSTTTQMYILGSYFFP